MSKRNYFTRLFAQCDRIKAYDYMKNASMKVHPWTQLSLGRKQISYKISYKSDANLLNLKLPLGCASDMQLKRIRQHIKVSKVFTQAVYIMVICSTFTWLYSFTSVTYTPKSTLIPFLSCINSPLIMLGLQNLLIILQTLNITFNRSTVYFLVIGKDRFNLGG